MLVYIRNCKQDLTVISSDIRRGSELVLCSLHRRVAALHSVYTDVPNILYYNWLVILNCIKFSYECFRYFWIDPIFCTITDWWFWIVLFRLTGAVESVLTNVFGMSQGSELADIMSSYIVGANAFYDFLNPFLENIRNGKKTLVMYGIIFNPYATGG